MQIGFGLGATDRRKESSESGYSPIVRHFGSGNKIETGSTSEPTGHILA